MFMVVSRRHTSKNRSRINATKVSEKEWNNKMYEENKNKSDDNIENILKLRQ